LYTRTTTAVIGLLTTGLLLTGCSIGGSDGKPIPTSAPKATTAPALSHAEIVRACTDAVTQIALDTVGEVPSAPRPAACVLLSESEYRDAYFDGIQQSHRMARDKLQRSSGGAATP
jgi:pectin methylesterase-like acyl-CoA thioesterase